MLLCFLELQDCWTKTIKSRTVCKTPFKIARLRLAKGSEPARHFQDTSLFAFFLEPFRQAVVGTVLKNGVKNKDGILKPVMKPPHISTPILTCIHVKLEIDMYTIQILACIHSVMYLLSFQEGRLIQQAVHAESMGAQGWVPFALCSADQLGPYASVAAVLRQHLLAHRAPANKH